LKKYKLDNFWDLAGKKYLSLETKRYVPKLIATLLIAKEPEKYGFGGINYQDPLRYDTITVGPGMSLAAIAMISNSTKAHIKELNRELRQEKTPINQSRYRINIPPDMAAVAEANLDRLHSIVSTGFKTHKIRKGETLTRICKLYNINKTTLLKANNLHDSNLTVGRNLRIPYSTVTYQLLPAGSKGAMSTYRDSLVLHRIKRGETISKISKQYGVPPEMIVAWNDLENIHSIRAGQQLALYIQNGAPQAVPTRIARKVDSTPHDEIKYIASDRSKNNKTPLIKAVKKKNDINSSSPDFQYYLVKNGDSLWTISRKFRITTADIKKWNNLKSNLIHPGVKIRLKKV
jgi:membrane-bound lytic murein transglycosylase D